MTLYISLFIFPCLFWYILFKSCAGFEVLTAVVIKSYIFWDITPCSLLKINRRFGRTYALLATCFHAGFLLGLFFGREDGGDMFLRNIG
jgi:hypothetical protein